MKLTAACRFFLCGLTCCAPALLPAFAWAGEDSASGNASHEQLLEEAASLQRTGQHDAALATYGQVLERYPTGAPHISALWQLAQLHDSLDQFDDARTRYAQLLKLHPTQPSPAEVLFALAWVELRSGKKPAARESFEKLHANYPQSPQATEATYWLAVVAADENRGEDALLFAQLTLGNLAWEDVAPGSRDEQLLASATCLKAQVAAAAGQWQMVQATVKGAPRRLLDAGTAGLQARFWLAEALFRLSHYDEAKQVLLELEPRTQNLDQPWAPMVPLRLAQLAAARQLWKEVLEKTEQIAKNHPDFALSGEVQYLRGVALAGLGKMTVARQAYRRVLEGEEASMLETAAKAQWMIGESFFHQRDFAQARKAYARVIENHPQPDWQARAALQAGKCWELEGNWQAAHTQYTAALRRWPTTQPQPQLQARLKWAEQHTTPIAKQAVASPTTRN